MLLNHYFSQSTVGVINLEGDIESNIGIAKNIKTSKKNEEILNNLEHLKNNPNKKTIKIKKKTLILSLIILIALSLVIFSNLGKDSVPLIPTSSFESEQQFLDLLSGYL